MRIVFAGSPSVAVPTLERLALEHEVVAVVTRAPSPTGRKRTLQATPVADAAARLQLPVLESNHPDAALSEAVAEYTPDLGVIVAYGGLLREPLLRVPRHGWINLHFSRLPAYRGAAPVQRALMAGERTAGISVFELVAELDAGPLYRSREIDVPHAATAGSLLDDLAHLGATDVAEVVAEIADGAVPVEQVGEASYAPKLTLADGALDFAEPRAALWARFRGVTPEPGAHAMLDGARCKLLELRPVDFEQEDAPTAPGAVALVGRLALARTGDALFEIVQVQPAGKRPMRGADWLRGRGGTATFTTGVEHAAQ